MRTLNKCFAGESPVQKCHQLAAGTVLCGALCFLLLIFGILYKHFPQIERIFDVWYYAMSSFVGMLFLMAAWAIFCILLKKWYVAMILSLGVIISWIITLLRWS